MMSVLMRIFLIRYESGWKAIMTGADGVILVYCPDAPSQDQLICDWYDYFVKKNGLKDEQCIVLAHRTSHTTERFRPRKYHNVFVCFDMFYHEYYCDIMNI